jgi:mRNA interferase RelE/StbE
VPESYGVDLTPAAQRDLTALARNPPDKQLLQRIDEAIRDLGKDPRPAGAIKLQGSDFWRIVVSDYRIIYDVDDKGRVVTISRVRHRREVYRE